MWGPFFARARPPRETSEVAFMWWCGGGGGGVAYSNIFAAARFPPCPCARACAHFFWLISPPPCKKKKVFPHSISFVPFKYFSGVSLLSLVASEDMGRLEIGDWPHLLPAAP